MLLTHILCVILVSTSIAFVSYLYIRISVALITITIYIKALTYHNIFIHAVACSTNFIISLLLYICSHVAQLARCCWIKLNLPVRA